MKSVDTQTPVSYIDLGINPLINASGSLTVLGGSIMNRVVLDAMKEGAASYVDIKKLKSAAGEYIAKLIGVEAAHVCSGASSGLSLVAAACITGTNSSAIESLPQVGNLENRFIIHKTHRNKFDHAVHIVGGKFIEVESNITSLREALSKGAAAIYYPVTWLCPGEAVPLNVVTDIAREFSIPTIVDAASQLPPRDNLIRFLNEGADAVVFSGGKVIGGPQSTGFILGKASIIEACACNDSPNVKCIGRGMKVGKEEILALLTAIRQYLSSDETAFLSALNEKVTTITTELEDCHDIKVICGTPWGPGYKIPRITITWNERVNGLLPEHVTTQLLEMTPQVHAQIHRLDITGEFELEIYVHTLSNNLESITVGRRLRKIFKTN